MFDKYFGFLKSHDEDSIIQSLMEHAKIDSEELHILSNMVAVLMKEDRGDLIPCMIKLDISMMKI